MGEKEEIVGAISERLETIFVEFLE